MERILTILSRESNMRSTQKQLGNWEPYQHLLRDRGRPRKLVSSWPRLEDSDGQWCPVPARTAWRNWRSIFWMNIFRRSDGLPPVPHSIPAGTGRHWPSFYSAYRVYKYRFVYKCSMRTQHILSATRSTVTTARQSKLHPTFRVCPFYTKVLDKQDIWWPPKILITLIKLN
jgi:hypothetical protein